MRTLLLKFSINLGSLVGFQSNVFRFTGDKLWELIPFFNASRMVYKRVYFNSNKGTSCHSCKLYLNLFMGTTTVVCVVMLLFAGRWMLVCETVLFLIGIFYGSAVISIYWLGFFVVPALWLSVTRCVVCCSNLSTKSFSLIPISGEAWIFYFVPCFQFQLIWDFESLLILHTSFPLQFQILAVSVFLTTLFSNHTFPFTNMQEFLLAFFACKSSDKVLGDLLLEFLLLLFKLLIDTDLDFVLVKGFWKFCLVLFSNKNWYKNVLRNYSSRKRGLKNGLQLSFRFSFICKYVKMSRLKLITRNFCSW